MLQRYIFGGRVRVTSERPTLSICTTCRDGREGRLATRGGARLAERVAIEHAKHCQPPMKVRGVRCMSQCKRPCIVSLSAPEGFTYMFGDLDPFNETHIASLFELVEKYAASADGFLERKERPKEFQANILGRFPSLESHSSLVSELGATG